ncbi:NADH dehydrogenase subunit A [Pseudarcicella hirudinis]|uniref:NADH-quinone oxidoreductase subunit A n=1 Tax=Pseudarcicella hirudinis TaxID=1079859 RepID=A0A1I5WNY8_9BACT|nr:NADH-quinone oxidoreductase subunit A [Pseudarcicella hirudinis]SFQ21116.1 NADH dehydrogenase subunit A [Pseudarcicella hirudinis]
MVSDFGYILLFIITAVTFCAVALGGAFMLRPNRPNIEKLSTYESGEAPDGNASVRFNIRFYIIALLFVLFDVELVFLFPWATVFGNKILIEETDGVWGWFALSEMFIFIGILTLGLAYAWVKGYLDWARPVVKNSNYQSKIPASAYEKINQKY